HVQDPPRPVQFPQPIKKGIVVENLSFSYPGTSKTVIDRISFSLKPGEHIALVGENGAGKTTLIKLLCRLYDPTFGRILLDGRNLADYQVRDVQDHFGIVFQDYMKYFLSARDNIGFGDVTRYNSDDRIYRAARQAGAEKFIEALPDRYDTMLGKMFENGEELSIGQWQKIALARSFLRNAPIVVLDEPTSSLDAKAEYRVYEHFKQLTADKMAIFISHRLATARIAHRILVLENGNLVEEGTHENLMARNGIYKRLFELQAHNYR
ncbi:ABC transporter ATP-binding protein, partial [candidate division KSB1 bacterium]|nr:ABC transporter ATP-binding protein [candidate division KSB1 bacterium]